MESLQITIPVEVFTADDTSMSEADRTLVEEAKKVSRTSYAPHSKFHVGAAVRLADGTIVCGSNQENAVFPAGCCAERTALYSAGALHPDVAVVAIAIAAWREADGKFLSEPCSPCGICRQHLVETEQRHNQQIRVVLYGTRRTFVLHSAADLLPLTFTGKELNPS